MHVVHCRCRLLLSWEDYRLSYLQQGQVVWVREEALAAVTATSFVELPAPSSRAAAGAGAEHNSLRSVAP